MKSCSQVIGLRGSFDLNKSLKNWHLGAQEFETGVCANRTGKSEVREET